MKPNNQIAPYVLPKPRMSSLMGYAAKPNDTNKGMDNVVMSTASASDDRPPPPPGAAKIRRTDEASAASVPAAAQQPAPQPAPLFAPDTPFGQILAARQFAEPANDMAKFARERSPPRGDRRPLSKRNKSRERRENAGGVDIETYGQIRDKALAQRSKTVPAEVFIGDKPKRARGPPNAAQLKRRIARVAASKRQASEPADDTRVKNRGGLADVGAERRQKLAANPRLYEDTSGNIKSRRVVKTAASAAKSEEAKSVSANTTNTQSKSVGAKSKFSKQSGSPDIRSTRPEDRYGGNASACSFSFFCMSHKDAILGAICGWQPKSFERWPTL